VKAVTEAPAPPVPAHRLSWSSAATWVRTKDPQYLAIKRSVRAAVVVPAVFGLTHALFSNPQVSLFGAFGSFALLLLVDFPGRPRTRLVSYLALVVAGSCFIALGTVVSTHKVAAVVVMAVVGFGVLFAGIESPQAATASTAALLVFVLPVAVAQPAGQVGPRLIGWAFAGTFCVAACMLVWPTPWHDNLRSRISATIASVSRLAAAFAHGQPDVSVSGPVKSQLDSLRQQFAGTPYPPTGAAASAVALSKLASRTEWVAGNALQICEDLGPLDLSPVMKVVGAASETLRLSAALVCDGVGHPVDDPDLVRELQESIRRLDGLLQTELDARVSTLVDPDAYRRGTTSDGDSSNGVDDRSSEVSPSLDPTFPSRALGVATEMVADAALEAAGAQAVGDRRLSPNSEVSSRQFWRRLTSHFSFRSVWFRNALRGAAGLALAVAVVEITNVEHGFWVALGTLSVLRSNALGTGATALRAIGGTTVGFLIGSAIMIGVSGHVVALWVLLPVAVLVSGVAPSMISFAAGQAGFTLVVIILFNIIDPTGWEVGLTRIEDVAIGCGVSIVVGVLFWPRGATAALGRAMSAAFVTSSAYLADAVDRLTITTRQIDTAPSQRSAHTAYLRLDAAFREFLAERGAKVVPVETVARLVTGSNRIRLAAYTMATLPLDPARQGQPELESVAVAGAVLRDAYTSSFRWYEAFAETLADRRQSIDPPPIDDRVLRDVLLTAFEAARDGERDDLLLMTMQMFWADQLLETQHQVQLDLADSAGLFARWRQRGLLI
jgi:Fusaric acid resistance protein-like